MLTNESNTTIRHNGNCYHRQPIDQLNNAHLGGLVLEQSLNEVPGQGTDPGGDVVLVLLDPDQREVVRLNIKKRATVTKLLFHRPRVRVLECLCLEGRLAHQEGVEDAPNAPHIHLVTVAFLAKDLGE